MKGSQSSNREVKLGESLVKFGKIDVYIFSIKDNALVSETRVEC